MPTISRRGSFSAWIEMARLHRTCQPAQAFHGPHPPATAPFKVPIWRARPLLPSLMMTEAVNRHPSIFMDEWLGGVNVRHDGLLFRCAIWPLNIANSSYPPNAEAYITRNFATNRYPRFIVRLAKTALGLSLSDQATARDAGALPPVVSSSARS